MTIASIRASAPAVLTADEERYLAHAIQRNTPERAEAREILAERNRGLVVSIAKRWQYRGLDLDDLIGIGNVGLTIAIDRYDPAIARFSTYATRMVSDHIRRGIADTGRAIRVPVHMTERIIALRRASVRLAMRLERRPTNDELAEELGVTVRHVTTTRQAFQRTARTASLDTPILGMDDVTLGDAIAVEGDFAAASDHAVAVAPEIAALRRAVAALPGAQRDAIVLRYGLDGGDPLTLEAIGDARGTVREAVRQAEVRAMKALRAAFVGTYTRPKAAQQQGGD